jgi:glycosyltransferase involved in cell wall biosynthesis
LQRLTNDYEVIVVDDASVPDNLSLLADSIASVAQVQLLRLDRTCGLSAALTVGIQAARGQYLVNLPAGKLASSDLIDPLLEGLVRADLVVGRPRRIGWRKAIHRLARIPRWFVLGLEVRDPECQVWAARREALDGLQLPRGMYRYLATLVAARGYRVGELTVPTSGRSVQLSDGLANPGDLLAAWWLKRRWQPFEVTRILPTDDGGAEAKTIRPWRRSA